MHTTRLIAAASSGDREALTELFVRHQGRLLSLVRARTSGWLAGRVAPEDVVQEALLEATRKVKDFEPDGPESFYRWLAGIARFKLREAERAARAGKRAAVPLDEPVAADQTSPSGRVARAERRHRTAKLLERLPERQAEAVRLRYLEGCSTAATAAELGCTESAIKSLVSRGIAALAELVDRAELD